MAYNLEAIVAAEPTARALADGFRSARVVPLRGDFALVPLTPALIGEVADRAGWSKPLLFGGHRVPEPLAALLERASHRGAVAYMEAEFWGGPGVQAAVVWRDGRVTLGPIIEEEDAPRRPIEEGAFNQALRSIGVGTRPGAIDEFATVGLDRFRRTEDWAEFAESPERGSWKRLLKLWRKPSPG